MPKVYCRSFSALNPKEKWDSIMKEILSWVASGEDWILFLTDIGASGINLPSVCYALILGRTGDRNRLFQRCGRVGRQGEDSYVHIIDHIEFYSGTEKENVKILLDLKFCIRTLIGTTYDSDSFSLNEKICKNPKFSNCVPCGHCHKENLVVFFHSVKTYETPEELCLLALFCYQNGFFQAGNFRFEQALLIYFEECKERFGQKRCVVDNQPCILGKNNTCSKTFQARLCFDCLGKIHIDPKTSGDPRPKLLQCPFWKNKLDLICSNCFFPKKKFGNHAISDACEVSHEMKKKANENFNDDLLRQKIEQKKKEFYLQDDFIAKLFQAPEKMKSILPGAAPLSCYMYLYIMLIHIL